MRVSRALAGVLGAVAAAHLALAAPALAVQPFLSSTGTSLLAVLGYLPCTFFCKTLQSSVSDEAFCRLAVFKLWGLCPRLPLKCV